MPTKLPNALLVFAFLLASSFAFTVISVPRLYVAYESRKWPICDGRIISSHQISDSDGLSANVTYSYWVCGTMYCGTNYDAFGGYKRHDVIEFVKHYTNGANIKVSYSPSNFGVAMLSPGFKLRWLPIVFSIILLWGFCFMSFISLLKSPR